MLDDILQQLPDEGATRRLLGALDRLEKTVTSQRKTSNVAAVSNAQLKELKDENLALRFKQKKAADRLDKLLAKLPGLFPELSDKNDNEAAAA
jgi:hypothetical protein